MKFGSFLRSLVHLVLLTAVAALLFFALAGDRGRLAILQLESTRAELEDQIQTLETDNRQLSLSLAQLRNPAFAAEKLARETFGLVRADEIVFVDAPTP